MGMAHMEQERQDAVLSVAKKSSEMLAEETGVKPSLHEGDMKEYLDEVLKEIENITTKTKK